MRKCFVVTRSQRPREAPDVGDGYPRKVEHRRGNCDGSGIERRQHVVANIAGAASQTTLSYAHDLACIFDLYWGVTPRYVPTSSNTPWHKYAELMTHKLSWPFNESPMSMSGKIVAVEAPPHFVYLNHKRTSSASLQHFIHAGTTAVYNPRAPGVSEGREFGGPIHARWKSEWPLKEHTAVAPSCCVRGCA